MERTNWNLRWALLPAALIGITLLGCGEEQLEGPATVPVKGKVVVTKNASLEAIVERQGSIEFESVEQPGVKAIGDIEPDGTFVVRTLVPGGAKPGAVPGQHRVRLYLDERAQKLVAPQFLRFDKSGIAVTVAEPQSDVEIQIWR